MKLEEYSKELYHCLHCHLCFMSNWHRLDAWVPACPSSSYFGFESFSAPGRIEITRAIIENEIRKPTPRLLQTVFSCTGCGACHEQCSGLTGFKADHVELFEELKAKLVDLGWGPLEKQAGFARKIQETRNPYGENHEKRISWLKGEALPKRAETVYFVGCTSSYRTPEIAEATVNVIKKSGVEFGVMHPDEWCCGSPLMRTGQRKMVKDLAKHNVDAIKASGAGEVIFSCAGCYKTFKKDYPAILDQELGFDVLHTTEYFSRLVKGGNLKLKKLSKVVTYHDPCHLGRGTGFYDPPRELLKEIFGDEFVEMKRNKGDAWCCGAGSGVKSAFSDFAVWAARERLMEAKATGASILISSCPFCKHNFADALKKASREFKMEVRDMSELVMGAAG